MMASNGWVSWETQDQQIGARPFDVFPNGTPDGAIVCRWGADPNLATDNVIDLAWSPIDPESAVAAMDKLEERGLHPHRCAGRHLPRDARARRATPTPKATARPTSSASTTCAGRPTKADVTDYVKAPTEAG